MIANLSALFIAPKSSISQALSCIDRSSEGIALVVGDGGRLIGTVTDGDIRRAILAEIDLDLPVKSLLEWRTPKPRPSPVTAMMGTPAADVLHMMNEYGLRHIPLVDEAGRVVELALLSELAKEYEQPLAAVIMAGGYGTRLQPLTENLPKPMLPVGKQPLLERIIQQLKKAGIRRVSISTHYKSEKIIEYFGDGQDLGVELNFVKEEEPLGTAGALGLMERPQEPLLVMNGDILTQMDFRAMLAYHREHSGALTVAVRKYDLSVPYGVIKTNAESLVIELQEKPSLSVFVNAGIYLLEPRVHDIIPKGKRCDMNEVIQDLLDNGEKVISFPIHEYWIDIGQDSDYLKAQEDIEKGRLEV